MSQTIHTLISKIEACKICIETPLKQPMPHIPRPVVFLSDSAKICIAGQAPSTRVHATGLPFNDASGNRLRHWMGVDRARFYDKKQFAFAPMSFCFPGQDKKGGDLPPRKECSQAWRNQIFDHMPQLELIILVGGYAQKWHLDKEAHKTLTETVFHWRDFIDGSPALLPTPHPSWRNNGWLKKNSWFEQDTVPWMQQKIQDVLKAEKHTNRMSTDY